MDKVFDWVRRERNQAKDRARQAFVSNIGRPTRSGSRAAGAVAPPPPTAHSAPRPARSPAPRPVAPRPSTTQAGDYAAVIARYHGLCHSFALQGNCPRGPTCTFEHRALPAASREELLQAVRQRTALNPRTPQRSPPPPRTARLDSPGSSPNSSSSGGPPRRPGICRTWAQDGSCPKGAACQWPHGDTQSEYDRVKAVRAVNPVGRPRPSAAGRSATPRRSRTPQGPAPASAPPPQPTGAAPPLPSALRGNRFAPLSG